MWFGTRRAPAAIAVRRSNRSRRSGSRSAKCSTFPSARSWLRNIRPRSTAARIAAARRRRRFPREWSRPLNMASASGPRRSISISCNSFPRIGILQLIPEDRTAQALSDLFDAPLICPASIVAWVRNKGEDLRQVYARIGERVAEVKVRHLDETGFRIAGKLQWLHTTSSLAFTFYRAGEKRGAIPQDLQGGVVVHDHFLP